MKLKSITFRCGSHQLKRIEKAMMTLSNHNRSDLISHALEEFLDYVDKKEIQELDLFALVERVDRIGSRHRFSRNA